MGSDTPVLVLCNGASLRVRAQATRVPLCWTIGIEAMVWST